MVKNFITAAILMSGMIHGLENTKHHIVLNGTSCSGKSTLAHQIATIWKSNNVAYQHFSIDRLYHDMLNSLSDNQKKDLPTLLARAQEAQVTHPVVAFEMWPDYMNNLFEDWFASYFDALQKTSCSILELVCDHNAIMKKFLEQWAAHHQPALSFVKIYCSKAIANERLNKRNSSYDTCEHRDCTTIEANYNCLSTIHGLKTYDKEVDTSHHTPSSAAMLVLSAPLATTAMSLNAKNFIQPIP
ncbi:hypothetical protein Noda2021_09970 [Candidatus Dependentiae bacterium Noda2021]|nr:hypothetical protein Noda2021_09970 [Candidatus Dependentiae bacterium Noda2021]